MSPNRRKGLCDKNEIKGTWTNWSWPQQWGGNNNNIVTNVLKYFIITIICWKEQLTIPPSRASWSSATIRTMLLSLPRASAHLMQQVSNVKSSATPARFSPFRLRPHHPGEIVGPSIGACEEQGLTRSHAHRHKLARGPTKTQFQFPFWGRSSARVSVQWTEQRSRDKHAVVRFEEVQLVIWSEEWAGSRLRTSCSWRDHVSHACILRRGFIFWHASVTSF